MLAQKRTIRVILDIECYDDLDIESQDWREILQLEGDEDVHATITDLADKFLVIVVLVLVGSILRGTQTEDDHISEMSSCSGQEWIG